MLPALLEAATAARAIAQHGSSAAIAGSGAAPHPALYTNRSIRWTRLTAEAKVRLLEAVDAEARRQDPRVTQVMVGLAAVRDTILVAG
jgi:TldD protein